MYIGIKLGIDLINLLEQNAIVSIANIMITTMAYVVVLTSLLLIIVFVGKLIHVLIEGGIKY